MATVYKVLGQSAPAATTATDVYTVPSLKYAVISTITVCSRTTGTAAAKYSISVRPNGVTGAAQHHIAFNAPITPNDTIALTLGLTVDAADVITVEGSTADLSFNVFGSEIDV